MHGNLFCNFCRGFLSPYWELGVKAMRKIVDCEVEESGLWEKKENYIENIRQ